MEKKYYRHNSNDDIFVIKDLNSTFNFETEAIDHRIIEDSLGKNWDNHFEQFFNEIINYIITSIEENREEPLKVQEAINFFFDFGAISWARASKLTKKKVLPEWLEGITESKEFFQEILQKNMNNADYAEAKRKFLDTMELFEKAGKKLENLKYPSPTITNTNYLFKRTDCSCDIILSYDSSFILPDCTALLYPSKEKIEDFGIERNNLRSVLFPIHPKVLLHLKNNLVCENKTTYLYHWSKEKVAEVNQALSQAAYNKILFVKENNHFFN